MSQTEETGAVYCKPAYTIKLQLKFKLRDLVTRERQLRGISWEEISRNIGIPATRLTEIGKHRKYLNWYILNRLLCYYHKQLEIRLVDMDK